MKDIIFYGNEILSKPVKEVTNFDQELRELVEEMGKIMKEKNGVGLAANQIGINLRVAVIDVEPAGYKGKITLINPKVISKSKKLYLQDEGCLSIPGIYLPIPRNFSISVRYQDLEGRNHIINASGYFAKAIQHEIDHLDGILFIERFREVFEIEKIEDENLKKTILEILSKIDEIKKSPTK